jgi:D-serine deaminase-like pyridoxal phosphate-dependent protein
MTTPLAARIAREYGTPIAVIDMDRVERNIARVQAACDAAGVANRPHIKTHKSPMLAKLQIAAGARGITCQKLGEAEVMADAGIDDVLISYNLIGEEKMARLGALQAKARMTVAVDNSVTIAGLPQAARISGRPLAVVVECDTGRKRAGVETPAEAIALAREIAATDGLRFAGFMLYPTETGWVEAQRFHDEALAGVRAHGLDAAMVSTGGTPNLKHVGKLKGATEHRPGTYIYNDRMQVAAGVAGLGRLRAHHLFDRGEPRRTGARHPRCRFKDPDLRHWRRTGRSRLHSRASGSPDRALRRRARLSRPRPQQHPPSCRRRGPDHTEPCLRRRQHDGRSADGARR